MPRFVIDYDPDPDFSLISGDYPELTTDDFVSLQTTMYDDDGKIIGSLSDSQFFAADDDWIIGTFNAPDDIPERCVHLRGIANDLSAEYAANVMQRFNAKFPPDDTQAALIRYRLLDPHGVTCETDVCSIEEAGIRAARFILAQASEGYAGSIDFTGSGLKRR